MLRPYLYHNRPCYFPVEEFDATGRMHKRCRRHDRTTVVREGEVLPRARACLREEIGFAILQAEDSAISDNGVRDELFSAIRGG